MSRETEELLEQIDAMLADIDAAQLPTPMAIDFGRLFRRLRAWIVAMESVA